MMTNGFPLADRENLKSTFRYTAWRRRGCQLAEPDHAQGETISVAISMPEGAATKAKGL